MISLSHGENSVKVLIMDLSKHYGGSSSRVLSLLRYLPTGQVGFVGLKNSPISRAAKKLPIPVHWISSSKADPMILPRLKKIIQQGGYQVIDTHNIQSKFWGSMAAIFTGITLVSTLHSWYAFEHEKNSWRGRIYSKLEKHTNLKLDLYITVSNTIQAALIDAKIQSTKIELIHNAVFIDPITIPRYDKKLEDHYGISTKSTIFTAVGRLVPVKGYFAFINAFHKIANQHPDSYCLIVGEGELHNNLKQKIHELKLQNRIFLLGYCDHSTVLSILKSSDVFVMPSRYEGTPIALLEAAALGKAIIASHVGGIPELVTNGESAILFPPANHHALVEALEKFANNKKLRDEYGERAQLRVQEKFTLNDMINSTHQAYLKARKFHYAQKNISR